MTRITSSDVIDRLLAALSRTRGEHSSITITRGMSGKTGFEVVVRTGDETGIETTEQARIEAQRQFDSLALLYADQGES